MKQFLSLLGQEPAIKNLLIKNNGKLITNDNQEEALVLASAFLATDKRIIIVKKNLYSAQRLYERIANLLPSDKCLFFPVDESYRVEAIASSQELLTQRLYVLSKVINGESNIVITHTAALIRHLPKLDLFKSKILKLTTNQKLSMEDFVKKLSTLGYENINKIEHSLQFARRGGVIDIFSINNNDPVRIEFLGDQIDNIRFFDLNTQKTKQVIEQVTIIPATDLLLDDNFEGKLSEELGKTNNPRMVKDLETLKEEANYSLVYKYYHLLNKEVNSLADYVTNYHLILSNSSLIEENYQFLLNETFKYLQEEKLTKLKLHSDFNYEINKINKISYIEEFKSRDTDLEVPLKGVDTSYGNNQAMRLSLERYLKDNKVVLCVENKGQLDFIVDRMKEWDHKLVYLETDQLPKEKLSYIEFSLKEGFVYTSKNIVYLSSREIFGTTTVTYRNYLKYKNSTAIQSYENLAIGDFVVHETHGVGKFLGIKTIEMEGIHRDYLHIGYKDDGVLYVPLEQFRLIRKFVSKEGIEPKLNKLGSNEWKKTKSRVKERIADIADKLLATYTERVKGQGFAFEKDNDWQIAFESSFPFELTNDQARSVQDIKKDMESPEPMDRLLCGDVGFGKTEVAFIAAFKAIMSGKQVAILAPTTILAKQHYDNALIRFQNFPIEIGMLSRFVSPKEQEQNLLNLETGKLNLLIGTHRMLSNDVKFKDLGLLVVDEEQRFGVEHKEKIKMLKTNVDVLTLSATPIPRTLQMALVGIRSTSQIDTPPLTRMPIQTYVIEKNIKVIVDIIERELARNGQVFYLYNQISSINTLALQIQKEVKGAKVIVVHGKMNREEIENSMHAFNNREANVMVCTTIIENGIDIPNANTILIENADKFGLAQLYQIKGRVGRSDRLAYAYLMYQPRKEMSETATKRLRAIKEFTELGSGYKIALRDLSIRGAGDLLGAEQSGFIDLVGIDTYIRLLNEAIVERKTGVATPEVKINQPLHLDAYINQDFTNDDFDKIDLYKKIDETKSAFELKELEAEMKDVYGKLPQNVKLLLDKRRFELLDGYVFIDKLIDDKDSCEIKFNYSISSIDDIGILLFKITGELSKQFSLAFRGSSIYLKINKSDKKWLNHLITVLEKMTSYLKNNS
jgi:transcription-repair coupling factor (superfamily II helicase)